jgi:two-component sensor histidine kinase
MPSAWARGPIRGVVERAVAPHGLNRFDIVGPPRDISSKCAVVLALALHEMATNSVKYGALRADGRVRVEWSVDDEFRFTWTEAGGPKVQEPTRKGFGSRMIERVLASYFRGTAALSTGRKAWCSHSLLHSTP